jgi:hypothetical protein
MTVLYADTSGKFADRMTRVICSFPVDMAILVMMTMIIAVDMAVFFILVIIKAAAMTALVMLISNHCSRHDIINHAVGYRSCRRSNLSFTDDNKSQ